MKFKYKQSKLKYINIYVCVNYRGRHLNYHYKITNLFVCICEHVHEGQGTATEIGSFLPYGL